MHNTSSGVAARTGRASGETGGAAVPILLAAVVLLLAFVGLRSRTTHEAPAVNEAPAPPRVLQEEPAPPAATWVETPLAVPPVKGPETGAGMVAMPDRSFAPPLNGAVNPPPAQWSDTFSPIVGTRRGNEAGAIDWYVHADGTMTTTIMLFRHELGRSDATTIVAHPRKPVPSLDAATPEPAPKG